MFVGAIAGTSARPGGRPCQGDFRSPVSAVVLSCEPRFAIAPGLVLPVTISRTGTLYSIGSTLVTQMWQPAEPVPSRRSSRTYLWLPGRHRRHRIAGSVKEEHTRLDVLCRSLVHLCVPPSTWCAPVHNARFDVGRTRCVPLFHGRTRDAEGPSRSYIKPNT